MNLKGTGVAIVTPFDKSKEVDYKSLGKVIDHCINNDVDYLVSLGTTGESTVLSKSEKQEVLSYTKKYVNGRIPLIAGFGGNDTKAIINNIDTFDLNGYSAILSASPSYNKPTQEGIYMHYRAIAENSPLPIILYNVPSRTAQNMKAKTTIRLANDFQNIIGIKEASNNLAQCMEIVKHTSDDFQLVSGDDLYSLPMFSFGCIGVISVIAQAIPSSFTKMVNAALSEDFSSATKIQLEIMELIQAIFKENNPAGIKAALNHLDLCENELRLPLVPTSEKLYQEIAARL